MANYREAYGMFATNGILFNHESPRRGPTFVNRKITRAVARIHRGQQKMLFLGHLDSQRDWGHAKDYVEGMWKMLQVDVPDDFVLATNETHPVREFVQKAFARVSTTVEWLGEPGTVDEFGVEVADHSRVWCVQVLPPHGGGDPDRRCLQGQEGPRPLLTRWLTPTSRPLTAVSIFTNILFWLELLLVVVVPPEIGVSSNYIVS